MSALFASLFLAAGAAAGVWLFALVLQWRRLKRAPAITEETRRAGLDGTFVNADPYRMFCRSSGASDRHRSRLPVILVHGLVVSSRYMEPLAKALSPYFRVIAPDLPGFGESEKPRQALDLASLANSLAAWLKACGVERAILIGNSFGCQVLAEFAVRHPQFVDRLVLQGPTVDPEARSLPVQIWRVLVNGRIERSGMGRIARIDYAKAGIATAVATMRVLIRDKIEKKLPLIAAPTLVVRGTRDPVVPQQWAERAAGLLPAGQLVLVDGGAHTLNYTYPDGMAAAILPFLLAEPERLHRGAQE